MSAVIDYAKLPLPTEMEYYVGGPIKVYSMWEVMEVLYPAPPGERKYHYDNEEYLACDYEAQNVRVRAYLDAHNLHYYARCKEDFFVFEALEETEATSKLGVVLDNLS